MSEPVAARVEEETKRWLENRAEQEDITVSKLAGEILDSQSGDVNDSEPDSIESELNRIEVELKRDVAGLKHDITALKRHAETLEQKHFTSAKICSDLTFRNGEITFPKLPGNDEKNVYGNGEIEIVSPGYRTDL